MKKGIFTFFFVLVCGMIQAQNTPVKFISSVKHISGDKYELIITAKIEPDWAIYSQDVPEDGPYPTTISYDKKKEYELIGGAKEVSNFKKVVNDKVFNIKLTKYYNNVLFKQVVRLKNKRLKKIQADIDYMICSSHSCMHPDQQTINFSL